jgi:hypothetical protein
MTTTVNSRLLMAYPQLESFLKRDFPGYLNTLKAASLKRQKLQAAIEQAEKELESFASTLSVFESDFAYAITCALEVNAEITTLLETHDGWWVQFADGYHDNGAYAALLTTEGQIRPCRRQRDEAGSLPETEREARQRLRPPLPLQIGKA